MRHKKAFLKVERQLVGKNTFKGFRHDVDKIFLYLFCFWMDVEKIHRYHQQYSTHHVKNDLIKNEPDLLETIIDWECARFTKPDKQLNAYETLMTLYPEYKEIYLPIIEKYLPNQIKE